MGGPSGGPGRRRRHGSYGELAESGRDDACRARASGRTGRCCGCGATGRGRTHDWDSFARAAGSAARGLRRGRRGGRRPGADRQREPARNSSSPRPRCWRSARWRCRPTPPTPPPTTRMCCATAARGRPSPPPPALAAAEAGAGRAARSAGPDRGPLRGRAGAPAAGRSWSSRGRGRAADDIAGRGRRSRPERLACLIYTSGTGGAPKGVMLPHRCLLANCRGADRLVPPAAARRRKLYLSFLPLSHSFEHTVGGFFLPSLGTEIAYARGVEHLAADMMAVRPTVMTVVPRILEVIARPHPRPGRARPAVAAQAVLRARSPRRAAAHRGPMTVADRLRRPRARPAGAAPGEGSASAAGFARSMSGSARLEPEVGRFFLALGLSDHAGLRPDRGRAR